jgi:membrane fusion protein, heavy metal efflux system
MAGSGQVCAESPTGGRLIQHHFKNRMKNFIAIFACALIIGSCKHTPDKREASHNPGIVITGDSILISAESKIDQRIVIMTVNHQSVRIPFTTTATVRALPECIAEVAVPFEGRILESFVKSGQMVDAGSPLFSMHSPVFFETVKAYLRARQEKQVAELNLRRQQDLVDHGIGIRKELDEARLNFDIAKGQMENLLATLSIYNVKDQDTEVGKPLIVTSPINGEVVRNNIRIGQFFTTDSDPMVCIANLKKVWVIAQVKESRIGLVQDQDEVEIAIDAYPERSFKGIVTYIGKILDEQTRSLEVIVECDNSDQLLKPGMFAAATFSQDREKGLLIPSTALIQGEDHTYVYKEIGPGQFVKTEVDVLSAGDGKVIVLKGIRAGEVIIGAGSIYLH